MYLLSCFNTDISKVMDHLLLELFHLHFPKNCFPNPWNHWATVSLVVQDPCQI